MHKGTGITALNRARDCWKARFGNPSEKLPCPDRVSVTSRNKGTSSLATEPNRPFHKCLATRSLAFR